MMFWEKEKNGNINLRIPKIIDVLLTTGKLLKTEKFVQNIFKEFKPRLKIMCPEVVSMEVEFSKIKKEMLQSSCVITSEE